MVCGTRSPKGAMQSRRQCCCHGQEGMGKSCSVCLILDHLHCFTQCILQILTAGCHCHLGETAVRSEMDVLYLEGTPLPPHLC